MSEGSQQTRIPLTNNAAIQLIDQRAKREHRTRANALLATVMEALSPTVDHSPKDTPGQGGRQ